MIGTWFAARQNRDKVILATKIAGPGLSWIRDGQSKIDKENIYLAVEGSLKRLQTDYIDLYQLHWPNRGSYHFSQHWDYHPNFNADRQRENFLEVLQTFDGLIKDGKIRHIGLSNETAWGTVQYLRLAEDNNLPRMVSIQNEYSLLNRQYDRDLAELSVAEECGLLAWSPLAGGLLSGKYAGGSRPEGSRWAIMGSQSHRDTPQAHEAVAAYGDVAQKYGLDVCQMAVSFVNDRQFVTSNIIGATTMKQLKTAIDSIDLTLSQDVLEDIQAVYRRYPMPF